MSCLETFSTLRIFSEALSPEEITAILGLNGTKTRGKDPSSKYKHKQTYNMWLWSTENKIASLDTEDHLNLIAEHFSEKVKEIETLRQKCKIDVMSYFMTNGQGGPSVSSALMKNLSSLGLDIWWDLCLDENT
jgi:hypothetical protein